MQPRVLPFHFGGARECILMLDKLMRKGKILVNGCYLCKQDAESCNHALWWSLFVSALLFGLLFIGSELGY